MAPADARPQERRGLRLLVLAPNPRISGPFPGPIARIAYSLVDALRGAGCDIVTELWGRHAAQESRAARLAGRARDLARIRRKVLAGRPDAVFVNTTHDLRALTRDLLLVYSLPRSVPWVLLYHGSKPEWLDTAGRARFTLATRLLVRRARAVLILSSEERRRWEALFPRTRFAVVANPYTPGPGSGPHRAEPGASVRALFSGRLMPEKGLYDLLEAMAQVVQQADCSLLIAGEGEIEADLRRRAADLGLQDRVEFLGFLDQEELGAVYARADMLVLPSYYGEGFPTVISEAMSHGLPIVTTPIRGAADHLVEGENVLFVPPHAPQEVAAAILALAGDEPLRRRLGENNLAKVGDFAPERAVRDYLSVFDQVAGRKPAG